MNLKYIDYFTQEENVSLNRLKQMLYLADWFNCLKYDYKLTNFEYKFEYNLIDAKGIYKLLSYDNDLTYKEGKILKIKNSGIKHEYNENELEILNFVKEKTKDKYGMELLKYTYSSYPISAPYRNLVLDLEKIAREYLLTECNKQSIACKKELKNLEKDNDFSR